MRCISDDPEMVKEAVQEHLRATPLSMDCPAESGRFSLRITDPPKRTQRPRYSKDGSRGPLKTEENNPVKLEVTVI